MRMRLVCWAALLGLTLMPAAARPDEAASSKPSVVVRIASVDSLVEDVRFLSELVGKEEEAKQIEGFIKNFTGPKGIEGIDTKKPIGVYATVSGPFGSASTGVVLLPISDEKDFLALVEKLVGNKPEKDGDVYTANVEKIPFPVFFRFADKYCYITIKDREAIDKEKLLTPAAVLAGKVGTASLTLNIDRIPSDLKNLALGQLEVRLARMKEQAANETQAHATFKAAVIDEIAANLKSLMREGGPVELRIDLDRASDNLTVSASLAGKPDSALAANIADLAKLKGLGAAVVGRHTALGGLVDVSLPEKVKAAAGPFIDEIEEKVRAGRGIPAAVLGALKPTLKSGHLDGGLDLRGPNDSGIYTAIAGVKVKDGEQIDKTLHKIVGELPPEVKDLIKLDFDKVDGAVIHRVTVPAVPNREIPLGDNPVFVAVRDDTLLIAAGDKGLEALKEVLGSAAKPSPVARVELAVSRLAPLMEKENPGAVEAAKKAFKEKDSDKVRIIVEGGPALQFRLAARTSLLKFFSLLDDGKKVNP